MNTKLMGIRIDNFSFEEGINKAVELINTDSVSQIITINPEMFAQAEKDSSFAKIIDEAEMVIPDGIGIKIALMLQGTKIQRLPGIDFAKCLLKGCAEKGYSVAIIGSKEEVINKAVENLKTELENLNIVYYRNGYFENNEEIYEDLKRTAPKLVLVALGSPKQEIFIYNAKKILPPCLMIGIGGSLDVWSGTIKRAPRIFQVLGLEWLYRTVTQPQRFKRIFPALPLFLYKSITYKKDK